MSLYWVFEIPLLTQSFEIIHCAFIQLIITAIHLTLAVSMEASQSLIFSFIVIK